MAPKDLNNVSCHRRFVYVLYNTFSSGAPTTTLSYCALARLQPIKRGFITIHRRRS
ncbi:hypothetical protein K431DRAFT_330598 [Polychaeton citri CBS 116435]|uniref:Uncharacterized protein n=1 Tax=Polychaeton citri CBS 116435 TaxID=1314669 RepID=A0A9P4Q7Z8_9PEZI|nr:hypothetical protein K431DRAFT_330598 [Polychaeton citri CBS 116435]